MSQADDLKAKHEAATALLNEGYGHIREAIKATEKLTPQLAATLLAALTDTDQKFTTRRDLARELLEFVPAEETE